MIVEFTTTEEAAQVFTRERDAEDARDAMIAQLGVAWQGSVAIHYLGAQGYTVSAAAYDPTQDEQWVY
jgi:hypothetical protein